MQTTLHCFRLDPRETGSPSSGSEGGEGPSSTTPEGGQVKKLQMITSSEEFDLSTFSADIIGKFAATFLHYFKKMM